jgi:anti-anti-sigma factor
VIDLRQLEFMDSTGLHVLIAAHQHAQAAGRRFALVRGAETVQRLFDLTGVAENFTIVDSLDELLEVDQAPGAP